MRISDNEFEKEKLIYKKINKLLNDTIEDLKTSVNIKEEENKEFKNLVFSNPSEMDNADIVSSKIIIESKENELLNKQEYYRKLVNSINKPYFASIIFEDEDKEIMNIYISITYLKDKNQNNILYDWRAPICSLFYDYETGHASYEAPGGIFEGELKRKRQYKIVDKKLIGVFDNSTNIEDDVLQDVLLEDSTGSMKNIVNTIATEQNKIIRNDEYRNLIVQGIAGSGKSTIALHRIAYLLYKEKNLTSDNILIFSPTNLFSDYIKDVLPSLGEENTKATTFTQYLESFINEYESIESFTAFIARYYRYEDNNIELIKYKQSDSIIDDLNNYLIDIINNTHFEDNFKDLLINIDKDELTEMIQDKYSKLPLFERIDNMAEKICDKYYKGKTTKFNSNKSKLLKLLNIKQDYKQIYKDFWLSDYCAYPLTLKETDKFINKKELNYDDALLLAYLKGSLEGFIYDASIRYIVIDEAQDYNKLQYIIINRIFKRANITILGDINQNINPYYQYTSLKDLENIFEDESLYIELNKTYRSSPEIVDYTNKILGLNHINAVRDTTENEVKRFRIKDIDDLKNHLIKDTTDLNVKYKTTAIICKDYIESKKIYEIIKDYIEVNLVLEESDKIKEGTKIIPAYISKGLEFDGVIIYNDRANTYRLNEKNLLYVAATRAQHELYVYN